MADKACVKCPLGQHPIYARSDSSIADCVFCPGNQTYNMNTLNCECPLGQYLPAVAAGAIGRRRCVDYPPCGENQVRNEFGVCHRCGQSMLAVGGKCVLDTTVRATPVPTLPGSPTGCPPGQIRENSGCVFLPCPSGTQRVGAGCLLLGRPAPAGPRSTIETLPPTVLAPPQVKALPPSTVKIVPPPKVKAAPPPKVSIVPPPKVKAVPPPKVLVVPKPIKPQTIRCPAGTKPGPGGCVPLIR
jgi:hypothetical protein